jgi:hypothetical protein
MRLLTLFTLFTATALSGCGAPSRTGDGSGDTALKAVDPSDDTQLSSWLAANEIERQPVTGEAATRGSSRNAKSIFLLYPRGETRMDALGVYALEVATTPAGGPGYVEFRRGREVLHREARPFDPAARFVSGTIPTQVREAVKPGESLTWGVFFENEAKANAVAVVRVVKKTSADKQIARLEGDPRNAKQPALVKSLGRSQLLFNNGLYGEALAAYITLADEQPTVGESWTRIVECMRRLELRDSPLYGEALTLMVGTKGGALAQGTPLSGTGLKPGGSIPLRKDPIGSPSTPASPVAPSGATPATEGPGTASPSGMPEGTPEGTPPTPEPSETPEPTDEPDQPTNPTNDPPTQPNEPRSRPGSDEARRQSETAQQRVEQTRRQVEQARGAVERANEAVTAAVTAGDPEAEARAREALEAAQRELERAEAASAAARESLDQAARAELDALLAAANGSEPRQASDMDDRSVQHLERWVVQLEAQAREALLTAQAATQAAAEARANDDPQAAELEAQAAALRATATAASREAATARRDLGRVTNGIAAVIR